jgi:hypothetical protein
MFKDCLVLSARENLGINGRFYTNGLELKHKLQMKNMREEDVPKEVAAVTLQCTGCIPTFMITFATFPINI